MSHDRTDTTDDHGGEGAAPAVPLPDLTRAMAHGDDQAWAEFHHQYFDRVLRYLIVVHRGDEDAARDSVQSTFLRVVRHVRQFNDERVFWSWLTCLARCVAADQHRGRSRYLRMLERFQHWRESRGGNEASGPRPGGLEAVLDECLTLFSPTDRVLIEKKYFERCSHSELAAEFGLTERAVESRLARLRQRLRRCLDSQPHTLADAGHHR